MPYLTEPEILSEKHLQEIKNPYILAIHIETSQRPYRDLTETI